MNILFVHTFYYPEIVGGAEYSVMKLAEELVRRGHRCSVLCSGEKENCEQINGVQVYRVKTFYRNLKKNTVVGKVLHYASELYNPGSKADFVGIIDKVQPDVIHTNCLYQFSPSVWRYARKKQIRIVHTIRDYFLSCYRTSMGCGHCDIPKVVCKAYKRLNIQMSKNVDVVTAPSAVTLNKSLKDGLFPSAEHIVIPNAIDFDRIQVTEQIDKHLNKRREITEYVYLGALSERKGIIWLLDTFQSLENQKIRLHIAGKGTLQSVVEDATTKDSRIEYHGFLSEQEVEALLQRCDVLIAPSLWEEPFGRVILDAYKQGIPVIATRAGGLQEVVRENVTGILVSPKDSDGLADAILSLHSDLGQYKQMCGNIMPVLEEYTVERQAIQFLSIYQV